MTFKVMSPLRLAAETCGCACNR